jgi:hypothetical protein
MGVPDVERVSLDHVGTNSRQQYPLIMEIAPSSVPAVSSFPSQNVPQDMDKEPK